MEQFWLPLGPLPPVDPALASSSTGLSRFVITPTVQANLVALARAVSSRAAPVLLQGPTSSGKTSLVSYLAARTGHACVRINNHEHTDLQEYIGSYSAGPDGSLSFQDGPLTTAVRRGQWVVLDELNLAPSSVLEALNRLLDDNRELFIPETQETVSGWGWMGVRECASLCGCVAAGGHDHRPVPRGACRRVDM